MRIRRIDPGTSLRQVLVVIVAVIALGLVALGARQLTVIIVTAAHPGLPDGAGGEVDTTTTTRGATSTTATDPESTSQNVGSVESPLGDPIVVFGEPTISPVSLAPVPDSVSLEPGVVVDLAAFLSEPEDPDGEAAVESGSVVARPDVVDPVTAPQPQPFGVGIWVEPDSGHYATITIGVNGGPNELADLIVDFGDGKVLDLRDELGDLSDGGVVEVVHRYEVSLTPQPWQATVTATDGSGETKTDTVKFTTQAEFLLSYSPLTVTALDDCDFFGKGDFLLTWSNDGRDRSSTFKLGKGERHIEENFGVGINGIRFGDAYEATIRLKEQDSIAVGVLQLAWVFGDIPLADGMNSSLAEVIGIGTHTVPVFIEFDAGSDCDTTLEFTATFAVSNRAG